MYEVSGLTSVSSERSFLFYERGVRKKTLQLGHPSVIRSQNAVFVQIARYSCLVAMKVEFDRCSRAIVWITRLVPRRSFVDAIPVNGCNASAWGLEDRPTPPRIDTLDFFIAQPPVICWYP
jgi:hypothetical protein